MKWLIFKNLSTTTNTESEPLWVLRNPRTKSLLKSSQISWGMGRGVYRPVFWTPPFATWQIRQLRTNAATSLFSFGQWYHSDTLAIILSLPICPLRPFPWRSLIIFSLKYVLGMHSWFPLNKKPSRRWNPCTVGCLQHSAQIAVKSHQSCIAPSNNWIQRLHF